MSTNIKENIDNKTETNSTSNIKKGVLLINLGTPDSYKPKDIRRYLNEFLSDPNVISIPWLFRFLLLQLVILPRRPKVISKAYESIWMKEGSPLLVYGKQVQEKLQEELGDNYVVELGMRYGIPSIKSTLEKFKSHKFDSIKIIPLFPQYAAATTGSIIQKVTEIVNSWDIIPSLDIVSYFYNNEKFINTFVELGKKYLEKEKYDHIVFSFHSLPQKQIKSSDYSDYCKLSDSCCEKMTDKNQYCYRAQSVQTALKIADKLSLDKKDYTICFQSRLGRGDWIQPYTEDVIQELPKKGMKKVLIFSPSFVSDCLESTYEIGLHYNEHFIEVGGEKLQLVESLNSHPLWIETLKEICLE